jgi:hypothetical protein
VTASSRINSTTLSQKELDLLAEIEETFFPDIRGRFFLEIDQLVHAGNDILSAITHWAARNGIEPEVAGLFLKSNPNFLAKLAAHCENTHILAKTTRLPI